MKIEKKEPWKEFEEYVLETGDQYPHNLSFTNCYVINYSDLHKEKLSWVGVDFKSKIKNPWSPPSTDLYLEAEDFLYRRHSDECAYWIYTVSTDRTKIGTKDSISISVLILDDRI